VKLNTKDLQPTNERVSMNNVKQIQSGEYQKGYAAGRKRQERDAEIAAIQMSRDEFRREIMKDILVGLMTGENRQWGADKNGKHEPYTTVEQYAKLANTAAIAAMKYYE